MGDFITTGSRSTGKWPPETAIAVKVSRDARGMQRARYPLYQSRPRSLPKNHDILREIEPEWSAELWA